MDVDFGVDVQGIDGRPYERETTRRLSLSLNRRIQTKVLRLSDCQEEYFMSETEERSKRRRLADPSRVFN